MRVEMEKSLQWEQEELRRVTSFHPNTKTNTFQLYVPTGSEHNTEFSSQAVKTHRNQMIQGLPYLKLKLYDEMCFLLYSFVCDNIHGECNRTVIVWQTIEKYPLSYQQTPEQLLSSGCEAAQHILRTPP